MSGRPIGSGHPCYVIAEAGANHNRDLDIARRLIDVAADAGADAVKFQTYSGKTLYSTKTPRFDYLDDDLAAKPAHELLEEISLPRDWQPVLAEHCRDRGVEFMSSPFDRQAVDELDALDVGAFKIASFELVDLPFIRYAAARGRALIMSTGMASLGEIDDAVTAAREAGAGEIALLQCASLYPAPAHAMNLRSIPAMHQAFGVPVGLSDHTRGTHVAVAAVAMGACIVEKHFTLDRSLPGPDHPFAAEPKELHELVSHIRDTEAAFGDGVKRGPTREEAVEMYTKARRSVVAAVAIPVGTVITAEMLTVKRPGFGIKPKYIDLLVGRVARVDIDDDDVVTWDMV
ncbi:MAG TPA: N-acetylneuraminate synthase family protein [Acidimicrobiia bacterium]|nr:N-acetylneuraminate synthase family protein [Acidimicrobiia bacterium]